MDLRVILDILWRHKGTLVVVLLVALAIAAGGTAMITPHYVAVATVRVATGGTALDYADYLYAERLMNTYVLIATSDPVLSELYRALGPGSQPEIALEVVPDSELVRITADDANPVRAMNAANTLVDILIANNQELYSGGGRTAADLMADLLARARTDLQTARAEYERVIREAPGDGALQSAALQSVNEAEQTYQSLLLEYQRVAVNEELRTHAIRPVEPARLPLVPASPNWLLNLGLATGLGLVFGLALSFLLDNFDTRLHSSEQAAQASGLPVLSEVPSAGRQPQVAVFPASSAQADAMRRLRGQLFTLDPLPASVLVTSAEQAEGKSTIAVNLAVSLAQTGRRVVLVDADLRLPVLHAVFGLPNIAGLSSWLNPHRTTEHVLQYTRVDGLQVLTSGPAPSNPAELLGSAQMRDVLQELAAHADIVVLDAPALLAVSDAAALAPAVDGVLLVAQRDRTRREALAAACGQLAGVKARLLGVVVNRSALHRHYGYYGARPAAPGRVKRAAPQKPRVA